MIEFGNVAPLMAAWESDPWGKLRPPVSVEAMRLSALLAETTYQMDVQRWIKAGWRDVTIQVDGELTDGIGAEDQSAMQRLSSAWKMYRVRQRIKGVNPIGQVVGAIRQMDKSDTGKALVMIHPAELGRYVVAISFMGTGERLHDWISNFRMTSEEGLHKGFLQLTRQFEENEEEIDFPETAQELGLERLTLRHVLQEMTHPNSRFTLWLSGHSQGAALMQIYAMRKIRLEGVLPRNVVGYGFAAPSVAGGLAVTEPSAFPVYLVQNSEDLVTRMGAQMHLGMCLIYPTTEALRRQCYTWREDETACMHRRKVGQVLRCMTDTTACIEATVAYLNVLGSYTPEDMLEAMNLLGVRLPVKKLVMAADMRLDALLQDAARRLQAAGVSISGKPVDKARIAALQEMIGGIVEDIGLKAYTSTLMECLGQPHRISLRSGRLSPYVYIAEMGAQDLIPAMWVAGQPPRMVHAACAVGCADAASAQSEVFNRRRVTPQRRVHTHPRYADPRVRRDTRHTIPTLKPGSIMPGERIIHAR